MFSLTSKFARAVALGVLSFAIGVSAQDTPLLLDGRLSSLPTVRSNDWFAGGTVTVNGFTVTVPDYMEVQFPAAFVPWADFVADASLYTNYEISITGNFVAEKGGEPIAGQISFAQLALQGSSGIISAVNPDGTMQIQNGPTIRINDPTGVYGVASIGHEFFTSDPENPSITSFSGFPMCVPRQANDPLCNNRPATPAQGTFTVSNAESMVPFRVGDQIDFSGIEVDGIILCYAITANNVQALTPNGSPASIRMEDMLIGVWNPNTADTESAGHRVVGYLSNGNDIPVTFEGIKPNYCTGEDDFVLLGGESILKPIRFKFDWRLDGEDAQTQGVTEYYKEYRITTANGINTWANGVNTGMYIQPVTEWIQAELTTPGLLPPANDFTQLYHLQNGLGWDAENERMRKRLDPFPQSNVQPPTIPTDAECEAIRANPPTGGGSDPGNTCPAAGSTTVTGTANYRNRRGGSLTVTCTDTFAGSSATINNQCIAMKVSWVVGGVQSAKFNMIPATGNTGTWTLTQEQFGNPPTSVSCFDNPNGPNRAFPVTLTVQ